MEVQPCEEEKNKTFLFTIWPQTSTKSGLTFKLLSFENSGGSVTINTHVSRRKYKNNFV